GYYIDPYYGYIPYTTTCTTRTDYYYNSYTLWIEKDAVGLKVKADTGSASVKLGKRKGDYRQAVINFSNLFYGRTRHLTLAYDLRGGGPRSTAERRVGYGYADFCAVGPGTDSGSLRVIVPAGFALGVSRVMTSVTAGGHTTYSTPAMKRPWTFYACFTGANDAADTTVSVPGPSAGAVTIQSWKDDPAWTAAIGTAIRDDLPKLVSLLGPLPGDRPLTIRERVARTDPDPYDRTTGVLRTSEQATTEAAATH